MVNRYEIGVHHKFKFNQNGFASYNIISMKLYKANLFKFYSIRLDISNLYHGLTLLEEAFLLKKNCQNRLALLGRWSIPAIEPVESKLYTIL